MKKRYRKKRILAKRRRSGLSASNWGPIVKLLIAVVGVLLAAAILVFGTMFTLEAVFRIDTPLAPDGFIGKAIELLHIKQPLIVSPTPYIPPEPTPTPHPLDLFDGGAEEKELVFPADISYQWLGSPYCYNDKMLCSAGKLIDGKSVMCSLVEYNIITGSVKELPITPRNGQLINAVFNDRWLVYLDANINIGGGELCVIDLSTHDMTPVVVKEIHVDQPEFKLEGDYIVWIERTGTSRDKIFVYHLPTQETTVIHSFERSGYGTSMPHIFNERIIWAAEDNIPHEGGRISSAIMYIGLNESTISQYLPDIYVHDPEYNGEYYAWLDAPHSESATLYVSNGVDAPIAVDTGVVEFGIGENFVAYGKDETVWVYVFDNNRIFRLTPSREITQFLGVSGGYIMWMDVTSRERDIIRYIALPSF